MGELIGITVLQFVGHLPAGMGYETVASSLSLDVGFLFLVGSSVLLSMVVQHLFVILVFSQEEISTRSSTPAS